MQQSKIVNIAPIQGADGSHGAETHWLPYCFEKGEKMEEYCRSEALQEVARKRDRAVNRLSDVAIVNSEDGLQFEVLGSGDSYIELRINGTPYIPVGESEQEIRNAILGIKTGFRLGRTYQPDPAFAKYEKKKLLPVFKANAEENSKVEKMHNGMPFQVVRRLTRQECDVDCLPLWRIRFEDGFEMDALPDEIYPVDAPKKKTR